MHARGGCARLRVRAIENTPKCAHHEAVAVGVDFGERALEVGARGRAVVVVVFAGRVDHLHLCPAHSSTLLKSRRACPSKYLEIFDVSYTSAITRRVFLKNINAKAPIYHARHFVLVDGAAAVFVKKVKPKLEHVFVFERRVRAHHL